MVSLSDAPLRSSLVISLRNFCFAICSLVIFNSFSRYWATKIIQNNDNAKKIEEKNDFGVWTMIKLC